MTIQITEDEKYKFTTIPNLIIISEPQTNILTAEPLVEWGNNVQPQRRVSVLQTAVQKVTNAAEMKTYQVHDILETRKPCILRCQKLRTKMHDISPWVQIVGVGCLKPCERSHNLSGRVQALLVLQVINSKKSFVYAANVSFILQLHSASVIK